MNISRNQMAESNIARKIGYKQAFKAITIGLAIAYIIMALVTMFGFIPIMLVGIWFGHSVRKRGDKRLLARTL